MLRVREGQTPYTSTSSLSTCNENGGSALASSHTPATHCTVSAFEGRSEVTASVVYKSYPESRKALQKLEGKIFKGGTYMSMLVTRLFDEHRSSCGNISEMIYSKYCMSSHAMYTYDIQTYCSVSRHNVEEAGLLHVVTMLQEQC